MITGTKLGAYEVLSQIGAGGMGEVYQAHDTKLGRDVAIKVLPEAFAHDPQRLSRFQREAKLLASLNHPNIATIHGLEESNGTHYLVMELVPGETLRERVAREGALPVEEALSIGGQMAEALEAAHEKSVIHRDLKPANVKVTPEGKVKVLDFGLAKAFEGEESGSDPMNSPTLSQAATLQGVILGTAAYMSPEQAKGKAVDKRTDLWAFGCVLYGLLTGKQAFHGDTVTEILAAVLKGEPDWQALPETTPLTIGLLLRRCLQKDVNRRVRDAADVRIEIEEALAAPPSTGPSIAKVPRGTIWRWAQVSGLAFLAIGSVALGALLWRARRHVEQAPQPLVRMDVDLGPDVTLGSLTGADAILSPGGSRLVYVSQGRLFTRRLDQAKATELAGTAGAFAPFFSPDGQWVGFFAQGKLKKISVEGGAAVDLCDAPTARGGSWGEDGNIIATLNVPGVLSRVPSAGGAPAPVTELDRERGEVTHRWPQILPGGKAVLFTAHTTTGAFDGANVEVMSFADRQRKTLLRGGTFGRYLPSGHLLYVSNGTLFAVPFDPDRLEVHGTPTPVLKEVGYNAGSGSAQFDFSRNGTLVYRIGGTAGRIVTVQWLDSAGKTQPLLAKPGFYERPALSPDGQRLALEVTEGSNSDVWIYERQRDTMTRLTFGAGGDPGPIWSPDGRYVVFEAPGGMFWTRADGSGKPQPLTQSKNLQQPWSFTSDGKRLAFMEANPGGGYHVWTLPLKIDDSGMRAEQSEAFLHTSFDERHPSFSPDGRWLAYTSSESGSFQVYVRAFPEKGGKWQISNSGALYPEWSRNGHELFFRTEDNRIMVATYTVKGDSFVADKPRVWTERRLADLGLSLNFTLATDGKRVAALMPVESPEAQTALNHVVFLMNFFDELRRRVPSGK